MRVVGILCFSSIFFILSGVIAPTWPPPIQIDRQQSAATLDANFLGFFDLGLKRIYTDILWIKTLLESDLEHYKGNDHNSWMFHRFHTISLLDPKFIQNYWYGGQYLSVIKDDDIGAKLLFERGLKSYPNDLRLRYYAGSHYLIELHDEKNALLHYEKILHHPDVPYYIKSLVPRLKAELGYLDESLRLMRQLYQQAPADSPLKAAYHQRLYAIKAEVDLACLNSQQQGCHTTDLLGHPYIKENNIYRTQLDWKKLRLYRRKK